MIRRNRTIIVILAIFLVLIFIFLTYNCIRDKGKGFICSLFYFTHALFPSKFDIFFYKNSADFGCIKNDPYFPLYEEQKVESAQGFHSTLNPEEYEKILSLALSLCGDKELDSLKVKEKIQKNEKLILYYFYPDISAKTTLVSNSEAHIIIYYDTEQKLIIAIKSYLYRSHKYQMQTHEEKQIEKVLESLSIEKYRELISPVLNYYNLEIDKINELIQSKEIILRRYFSAGYAFISLDKLRVHGYPFKKILFVINVDRNMISYIEIATEKPKAF